MGCICTQVEAYTAARSASSSCSGFLCRPDDLKPRLESAITYPPSGDFTLTHFQARQQLGRRNEGRRLTSCDGRRPRGRTVAPLAHRRRLDRRHPGRRTGRAAGHVGLSLDPRSDRQHEDFIHGVPLYGTLVGISTRRSVVGVIIPALAETAYAAVGHGAWYVKGEASFTRHASRKRNWATRLPHVRSRSFAAIVGPTPTTVCNSRPASRARGATSLVVAVGGAG